MTLTSEVCVPPKGARLIVQGWSVSLPVLEAMDFFFGAGSEITCGRINLLTPLTTTRMVAAIASSRIALGFMARTVALRSAFENGVGGGLVRLLGLQLLAH